MEGVKESSNQQPSVPEVRYCPSEIVDIFSDFLSRAGIGAKLVHVTGIYNQTGKQSYSGFYYDTLRDQYSDQEISVMLTQGLRDILEPGSLVTVGGTIFRRVQNKGTIQLGLKASRVEILQQQALSAEEARRAELRAFKTQRGFRNVDSLLEGILMKGERPNIALVFASGSITMADFDAGKYAAEASMDFTEIRVNFASPEELCRTLKSVDAGGYDVICLVRGGGSGIEHLDDLAVLETVAGLSTAFICAVGHVEEKLFIKQISDKVAPTPNGLGSWFSETGEKVAKTRQNSVAVITEQVKKQFQERIDAQTKQNAELQEKLKALTKQAEDSTKQNAEASKKITEQHAADNKKLQEQLAEANKKNGELSETIKRQTQVHTEQMKALNASLEAFKKDSAQQNRQHNESLQAIQKSNTELIGKNASLNEELARTRAQLSASQTGKPKTPVITYILAALCVVLAIIAFAS